MRFIDRLKPQDPDMRFVPEPTPEERKDTLSAAGTATLISGVVHAVTVFTGIQNYGLMPLGIVAVFYFTFVGPLMARRYQTEREVRRFKKGLRRA